MPASCLGADRDRSGYAVVGDEIDRLVEVDHLDFTGSEAALRKLQLLEKMYAGTYDETGML